MTTADFAANSWEARDLEFHLHGFHGFGSLREQGPTILSGGEGVYVIDVHGNRYLEGNSGLWNAVLGFNHPGLQEAVCEQSQRFSAYHSFFGRAAESTVELAEKMVEIAPVEMSKAYFTNSGSEANDSAVKMLWMINHELGRPERRKIITRRGAYHGVTGIAASMTARDYNGVFGLPLDGFLATETPHYWRYGEDGETEEDYSARLAENLDQLILDEDPDTVAGFFAEPVMGAGGVILPPKEYFPAVQAVLKKYDIPLAADEVICGLGRSGRLWGSQTFDIEPDIIVASKSITAGYFPLGAVLISPKIEAQLAEASETSGEFPNGFTCGGHPVACGVALKAIDVILNEGVYDNMCEVASHFDSHMKRFSDHPNIGEVRSVGLMGALEVVEDKETKSAFSSDRSVGDRIANTALQKGLICRPIGESIVLAPPFIITESQIDEMFEMLGETIAEVLPT